MRSYSCESCESHVSYALNFRPSCSFQRLVSALTDALFLSSWKLKKMTPCDAVVQVLMTSENACLLTSPLVVSLDLKFQGKDSVSESLVFVDLMTTVATRTSTRKSSCKGMLENKMSRLLTQIV